jgi:protein required for attachment to host cells
MAGKRALQVEKSPITWILVADARNAQVYTRQKVEKHIPLAGNARHEHFEEIISHEPLPVSGMKWKAEPASEYEKGRNAGRVFESAGHTRHTGEPHMNVHDEIRIHFARTIAAELNHTREEKAYDRLVLIAPAKMLGEIKKYLNDKVLKRIVAEMPKDLTHYEGHALAAHLDGVT